MARSNAKMDKLKNVIGVDSVLNKVQDLDILLETILSEARSVLSADAGSIYTAHGAELAISYSQNDTKARELKPGEKLIYNVFRIPIGTGTISGYAAMIGTTVNVRNVYDIPDEAPYGFNPSYDQKTGYRTVSTIAIPLINNMDQVLGVLQLINKTDSRGRIISFSKDDELVAQHFATNASLALQRAKMTRAILLRMTRMAELRDPKETGPHVNRVAGYSLEIYERWAAMKNRARKDIEHTRDILRMAAMLHDVGKVAISDTILKKPGRFEQSEREIMKSHTWLGARLFTDKQSEFDEIAQVVALNHHEHWDGRGYPGHVDVETGKAIKTNGQGEPAGKSGEEIPLMGRIVALADVYDALTSIRVYKEAWTEDDTLREIRTLSGTQFDPDVVTAFFEALPSIKTISAKFADAAEPKVEESPGEVSRKPKA
ncbi:MAG: GAF and HD-GYP domain-containing protein [Spirochaetales bacterium]